jgi:hypothetical protein
MEKYISLCNKVFIILSFIILSSCKEKKPDITYRILDFSINVEVPDGMGPLKSTWNSVGMDPDENIYVVFGDEKGSVAKNSNVTGNNYSDAALCKYSVKNGTYEAISSLVDVLKAENNWKPGEFVEKGHSQLPYMDGKIYIGTMEFSSLEGEREKVMSEMKKYRGGHLLSYEVKTGSFKDLSKNLPGSVLFPGQGLIALDPLPEFNYIVCLSSPRGDIALYNIKTGNFDRIIPGVDSELGNIIYREVISTPQGKIYFGFHDIKNKCGRLYVHDINTGETKKLPDLPESIINGLVKTRDRKQYYAITQKCDIISINTVTDEVKVIGNLIPEHDMAELAGESIVPKCCGLFISPDGKKLFGFPMKKHELESTAAKDKKAPLVKVYAGMRAMGIYEFDLKTLRSTKIFDFTRALAEEKSPQKYLTGYLTGSNLIDRKGRLYLARNGKVGLIEVDLSSRIDPGFPVK